MNHHAYLFEHRGDSDIERVYAHIKLCAGFDPQGHPDFLSAEYESFGIDEGRSLIEWQSRRPIVGDTKAAFIRTGVITREAQNALLKLFEDPVAGTYFFILVPRIESIIPTLQSRFSIHKSISNEQKKSGIDVKKLIAGTIAERMGMIESIVEEKDKIRARAFLDELESHIDPAQAETILNSKKYLSDQGSSVKMLLEMVVLSV